MNVVVTGGTGFVGANLVKRLVGDGHEVHLLVRDGYSPVRVSSIASQLRFHVVDLAHTPSIERILREARPEWIFHLAAFGNYSWQTDEAEIFRTNVVSTVSLLDAARSVGFASFVIAGSSSEYGFKDHAPGEDELLEPATAYAAGKASASMYATWLARSTSLPIHVLRLYSAYGPLEDERRFIPTLLRAAKEKKLPPLVDPNVARDFVYVDDVVEAFLMAAARDRGAVYNIGSGTQYTIRDVVELARDMFGIAEEPKWGSMPNRVWDTSCWRSDPSKAHTELGWKAKTNLATGLRLTAEQL